MYSPTIEKLIELFSKFPGVGPRTASRFVFYLLRKPESETKQIVQAINDLHKAVRICVFCQNPFEPEKNGQDRLCLICSDQRRDKTLLCLVEKEADLEALEKTRKYKGLYFVLGRLISPLRQKAWEKATVEKLLQKIKFPEKFGLVGADFQEIILALNYTVESQAVVLYLERVLKPLNKKISRLGLGLPIGGELEYADEETVSSALDSRKQV